MKLLILFLLISFSATSQLSNPIGGNFPQPAQAGTTGTLNTFNGGVRVGRGIVNGLYADTTAANDPTKYIKFYPAAQIVTYAQSGYPAGTLWIRNSTATTWLPAGSVGADEGLTKTGNYIGLGGIVGSPGVFTTDRYINTNRKSLLITNGTPLTAGGPDWISGQPNFAPYQFVSQDTLVSNLIDPATQDMPYAGFFAQRTLYYADGILKTQKVHGHLLRSILNFKDTATLDNRGGDFNSTVKIERDIEPRGSGAQKLGVHGTGSQNLPYFSTPALIVNTFLKNNGSNTIHTWGWLSGITSYLTAGAQDTVERFSFFQTNNFLNPGTRVKKYYGLDFQHNLGSPVVDSAYGLWDQYGYRHWLRGKTVFGTNAGTNNWSTSDQVKIIGNLNVTDSLVLGKSSLIGDSTGFDFLLRRRTDGSIFRIRADLIAAFFAFQPLDADLTTIAGLTATTDNFIQSKAGAWASRTIAQVKTDLGLTGTNSGDQTSIVGITGTTAQFNTALTDGDFATGGGTASGTNTGDQTTITGNAGTATALQTARNIQGVAFDGTANIDIINGTGFVKATGTALSYDNSSYQPLDGDLTTIAGLTATTNNIIQSVGSAWASRTPAQLNLTLPVFTDVLNGLVPLSGGGTTNFLRADGVWTAPGGSGSGTVSTGAANTLAYYPTSGTTVDDLTAITASRALVSDANGLPVAASPSTTELNFVDGVTSSIQTQLDGKANTALSNLASVAVNTTIASDADNTDDLGTSSISWKDIYTRRVRFDGSTSGTADIFSDALSNVISGTVLSGTGTIPVDYDIYVRSDETLSASNADQPLFTNTAHDVITILANTTYDFEFIGDFTHGATSHDFQFGMIPTTATITNIAYYAILSSVAVGTPTTSQYATSVKATATTPINLAAANAVESVIIRGWFTVGNTGGTIQPTIQFSVNPTGTVLLKAGARFKVTARGNDTFTEKGPIN